MDTGIPDRWCRLVGRVVSIVGDGPDTDDYPDEVPLTGFITLTPKINRNTLIPMVGETHADDRSYLVSDIRVNIVDGRINYNGKDHVYLLARVEALTEEKLAWTLSFSQLKDPNGGTYQPRPITFVAEPGEELSLTRLVPAIGYEAIGTIQGPRGLPGPQGEQGPAGPIEGTLPASRVDGLAEAIAAAQGADRIIPAYGPQFGYVQDDPSTHRAAIQAALDAAEPGQTVDLGAYTYTLTDKTAPYGGTDSPNTVRKDRVLVKKPGVHIVGNGAWLKIADNFGRYSTIIGTRDHTVQETGCELRGFSIDYNARGGNTMRKLDTSRWPRVGINLVSYAPGSTITVDVSHYDADNTNCVYVAANHIRVPRHYSVDTGKSSTEHHDHSTYYTVVTAEGGTQSYGPGAHSGGGYASNTAVEIHGGTISMAPWSVDGYIKAANITGSNQVTAGSDVTIKGLTGTNLCSGVFLWSAESVGAIRTVDLDVSLAISRNWYPGKLGPVPAVGITVEPNSTVDFGTIRCRGSVTYGESTQGVSNEQYSAGLLFSRSQSEWGIDFLDVDMTIRAPYAVGMALNTAIRGGDIRLTVIDPATKHRLKAGVSLSGTISDTHISLQVHDTRTPRAVQYVAYVDRPAVLTRVAMDSRVFFRDESSPNSYFQGGWVSTTVAAATGMESHSVGPGWRGAPGSIAGGSTHRDTTTGRTWVQTAFPSGSTWRAINLP